MPTFQMVKKSGGSKSGSRVGVDGGIKNSRFTTTSKGKAAQGTYSQVNARVAANHPANGTASTMSKKAHVNSGSIMASGGQKKGMLPTGSAMTNANVRVKASGPTPKPPRIDEAPTIYSGKNKNLTRGTPMQAGFNAAPVGFSGSSNGRTAIGQTGSGIGKKKKFSVG